jgi:hypothetical protein
MVRNWINKKSIHLIDNEHDNYAFKIEKVLEKLWLSHLNGSQQSHLSCGSRSYAMKEILRLLGIKSRIVDVFQITEHKINPHTLIEVYDSDNGAWILQDPDFNAEYIIKSEEKPDFFRSHFLGRKISNPIFD